MELDDSKHGFPLVKFLHWRLSAGALALLCVVAVGRMGWKRAVERNAYRAAAASWKIEEILKWMEREPSDRKTPVRLGLVGGRPPFGSRLLQFAGGVKKGGSPIVFAADAGVGDFADYLLFQTAAGGTDSGAEKSSSAIRVLESQPPWFQKTFSRLKEWSLPDGSKAVLYKQAVREVSWPAALGEVELELREFPLKGAEARGLKLRLVPGSAENVRRGLFSQIVIKCQRLSYRGLIAENLTLDFRNAQINLPRLLQEKEIHFLRVDDVSLSVSLGAEALRAGILQVFPFFKEPRIVVGNDAVVKGRWGILPVEMRLSLDLSSDKRQVGLDLVFLEVAGVPFPPSLLQYLWRKSFSLEPSRDLPFRVRVQEVFFQDGSLIIKGG